jgi:hypothetical protein
MELCRLTLGDDKTGTNAGTSRRCSWRCTTIPDRKRFTWERMLWWWMCSYVRSNGRRTKEEQVPTEGGSPSSNPYPTLVNNALLLGNIIK